MRPSVRHRARWMAVILVVGVIFVAARTANLTLVPGEAPDLLVRKLAHAVVYAALAILITWAMTPNAAADPPRGPARHRRPLLHGSGLVRRWLIPLVFVATVALTDELLQSQAPGREAKVTDLATDVTGAVAGLILLRSWRSRRRSVHDGVLARP